MGSNEQTSWYRQEGEALLVHLYVQPRASRSRICGIHEGELKLQLAAPPVDGAANDACRSFFARLCKVPRSAVTILAGETSRHKRLRIAGGSVAPIMALLGE